MTGMLNAWESKLCTEGTYAPNLDATRPLEVLAAPGSTCEHKVVVYGRNVSLGRARKQVLPHDTCTAPCQGIACFNKR